MSGGMFRVKCTGGNVQGGMSGGKCHWGKCRGGGRNVGSLKINSHL